MRYHSISEPGYGAHCQCRACGEKRKASFERDERQRRRMKRGAGGKWWIVAWRTDWESGQSRFRGRDDAEEFMQRFDGPRSWAALIDPVTYGIARAVGTRFVDLARVSGRKAPGKEVRSPESQLAARAAGNP